MKVRIVKLTPYLPGKLWYAGQLGNVFCVEPDRMHPNIMFQLKEYSSLRIHISDCEILPDENPKPEPFDLGRALKGEKMVDDKGGEYTIVGKSNFGKGYIVERSMNGNYDYLTHCSEFGYTGCHNLKMSPRPSDYVTKWVNVYLGRANKFHPINIFDSKEEAIKFNADRDTSKYICTVPITFKLLS